MFQLKERRSRISIKKELNRTLNFSCVFCDFFCVFDFDLNKNTFDFEIKTIQVLLYVSEK